MYFGKIEMRFRCLPDSFPIQGLATTVAVIQLDLFNDRNLLNGNKLRTYRCFKISLVTEDYVKLNIRRHDMNVAYYPC